MARLSTAIVLAAAVAGGFPAAKAQLSNDKPIFLSGNKLLEICRSKSAACSGYVMGALDQDLLATTAQHEKPRFCWPPNVTSTQVADLVTLFLENNPDQRHYSAASTVLVVTMKAFPCP